MKWINRVLCCEKIVLWMNIRVPQTENEMLDSDKDKIIFNKPGRYMNRGVTILLWMRLIRYQSPSYNEFMDMQKISMFSQRISGN